MKKLFKIEYAIWWLIIILVIGLKFIFVGNAEEGLFSTPTYSKYGLLFKIIVILLWSSVFGSLLNWIYKLISKKNSEKIHLTIISILAFLSLIIL
tara:strand:+ start:2236 stop:2520 length:285 start_codon:yes stop_codon:yes gene_type:complete